MATVLNLYVYIIGLGNTAFPLDIESHATVGHLKDAIKEKKKNDLKDIDADRLTLYKVSIPYGKNLEQLARQAIREAPELDVSPRKLSKVFQEPIGEEEISIVVTLPDNFRIGACLRDSPMHQVANLHILLVISFLRTRLIHHYRTIAPIFIHTIVSSWSIFIPILC
jgi:crinkler effector protein